MLWHLLCSYWSFLYACWGQLLSLQCPPILANFRYQLPNWNGTENMLDKTSCFILLHPLQGLFIQWFGRYISRSFCIREKKVGRKRRKIQLVDQQALCSAALHWFGFSVPVLLTILSSLNNLHTPHYSFSIFIIISCHAFLVVKSLAYHICLAYTPIPYTNSLVFTLHTVFGNFLFLHDKCLV